MGTFGARGPPSGGGEKPVKDQFGEELFGIIHVMIMDTLRIFRVVILCRRPLVWSFSTSTTSTTSTQKDHRTHFLEQDPEQAPWGLQVSIDESLVVAEALASRRRNFGIMPEALRRHLEAKRASETPVSAFQPGRNNQLKEA